MPLHFYEIILELTFLYNKISARNMFLICSVLIGTKISCNLLIFVELKLKPTIAWILCDILFHMSDLGVYFTFHFHRFFLRDGVLILNWKENKEAVAICFEIRIQRKKNIELLRKVPSKIYGNIFYGKKQKRFFVS